MTQIRVPALAAATMYSLLSILSPTPAFAFDATKLHCVRQERQGDQIFLSEIRFYKNEMLQREFRDLPTDQVFGELVSYSIRGTKKSYVSGYSFYSITYHNRILSGLTGDPNTRADGSFTLTKTTPKFNGEWDFVYSNTKGDKVEAVFKCIYKLKPNAQN